MKVDTDELDRQSQEINRVIGRLSDLQESVLQTARKLSRESVGEQFYVPLRSAAASIGQRGDELKQLRNALRQIARLYETSESRIMDEAEAAAVHNDQSPYIISRIPRMYDWTVPLVGPGGQLRRPGDDSL